MTYAELQNRLARYLGLQALADDPRFNAWGPDAINDALLEIAQELQIPRRVETVASAAETVTPTVAPQTWGILAAYNETDGIPLTVISYARTALIGSAFPRYLLYDPSLPSMTLAPAPLVPSISVRLYYAVTPSTLVAPTDEPFNGAYSEFHHVIALRAAMLMLEGDSGDEKTTEWLTARYRYELQRWRRAAIEGKGVRPRSEVNLDDFAGAKT